MYLFGDFVSIKFKYLLETNLQELGDVELGHLPTSVVWGAIGRGG